MRFLHSSWVHRTRTSGPATTNCLLCKRWNSPSFRNRICARNSAIAPVNRDCNCCRAFWRTTPNNGSPPTKHWEASISKSCRCRSTQLCCLRGPPRANWAHAKHWPHHPNHHPVVVNTKNWATTIMRITALFWAHQWTHDKWPWAPVSVWNSKMNTVSILLVDPKIRLLSVSVDGWMLYCMPVTHIHIQKNQIVKIQTYF